jgi:hypothetical protein
LPNQDLPSLLFPNPDGGASNVKRARITEWIVQDGDDGSAGGNAKVEKPTPTKSSNRFGKSNYLCGLSGGQLGETGDGWIVRKRGPVFLNFHIWQEILLQVYALSLNRDLQVAPSRGFEA